MRLKNLKKLDLSGCIVKFEEQGDNIMGGSRGVGNKRILSKNDLLKIKKEALAQNYLKFLKKRGPESLEEEEDQM